MISDRCMKHCQRCHLVSAMHSSSPFLSWPSRIPAGFHLFHTYLLTYLLTYITYITYLFCNHTYIQYVRGPLQLFFFFSFFSIETFFFFSSSSSSSSTAVYYYLPFPRIIPSPATSIWFSLSPSVLLLSFFPDLATLHSFRRITIDRLPIISSLTSTSSTAAGSPT